MNRDDLDYFRQWFSEYCRSFYTPDAADRKNISLKERHTYEVCRNIVRIADGQSLDEGGIMLAEAIGLFHDVGRFPQYARYRTFLDRVSVNHGELGAEVLVENSILGRLSGRERDIIITAVKLHNAFKTPVLDDPEKIMFLQMVRDADKLDIYRVFFEYYEKPADERPTAAGIGLPDIPGYSPDVLACVMNMQLVPLTMLRGLNDFKLTKMSWIYDLNFAASFRMLAENNYLHRIVETLPQTDEIRAAAALLDEYVRQRIEHDGS